MLTLKYALIAVIFLLIPLGISFLIYRFVKKRNYPSKYRLFALLPILFFGYAIYQGIVNPHSLYKSHFREITRTELPSNTEFLDYTDWGYGSTPRNNSSLFHVKVTEDFYEKLKIQLNPSSESLSPIKAEYAFRFHEMFGEQFEGNIDMQYSRYSDDGELIHLVGFFDEESSILVFYQGD